MTERKHGWQAAAARRCGLSKGTVSEALRGRHAMPVRLALDLEREHGIPFASWYHPDWPSELISLADKERLYGVTFEIDAR